MRLPLPLFHSGLRFRKPKFMGLISLALVAIVSVPLALSAELFRFELNDDSIVTGEIQSYRNKRFIIVSPVIGMIEIGQDDIRSMEKLEHNAASRSTPAIADAHLQRRLQNDETLMKLIMGLSDDPAIKAILADPLLMQAVMRKDVEALQRNPVFLRLLDHPVIRQIIDTVATSPSD